MQISKNENIDISPFRYLYKSMDIHTRVTLPDDDSSAVSQPASSAPLSLRHGLALSMSWCPIWPLCSADSDYRTAAGPDRPVCPDRLSESATESGSRGQ